MDVKQMSLDEIIQPDTGVEPESSRANDLATELEQRAAVEAYLQAQLDSRYGIVCKDTYYQQLSEYYNVRGLKRPWSADYLKRAIDDLHSIKAKTGLKKTSQHYCMLRRYELVETADTCHVVARPKTRSGITPEDTVRRQVVAYEQLYDKLMDLHLKMGHSRRDKMMTVIRRNFLIPRVCVVTFLQLCKVCATGSARRTEQLTNHQQQPASRVEVVPRAVQCLSTSSEDGFNGLGQVDVIDFRNMPDGDYKWLLRYEDLATKFVSLRPLKSDTVTEIAGKLLKIFLQFGAPLILQSSSGGHRLVSGVVTVLLKSWPTCKIVNAHRKSTVLQDAQFHATAESLETLLRAWMHEYCTPNWSKGCYFVQWRKNTSLNPEISKTPYAATFGVIPKSGLRGGPTKIVAPRLPEPPAPRPPAPKVTRKRRRRAVGDTPDELQTAITAIPDTIDDGHEAEQPLTETNHDGTDQVMNSYVLVLDHGDVVMMTD